MGSDQVLSAKDALPLLKPVMEQLSHGDASGLWLCVDEATQDRRLKAQILADEGDYEVEWCISAVEQSKGDLSNATQWLKDRAPKIGE